MQDRLNDDLVSQCTRAKDALVVAEDRYRRLFEGAQDGILILDGHSGLITDVNPSLLDLLDYSREDLVGRTLWETGAFKRIEPLKEPKAAFRELQEKDYVRYDNLPVETGSGRYVTVEFVSNMCGVNGKSVIQCVIRDITARSHAEQIDERVRQSQKMEAIGQLAGGVAHDFNNILGVILGYCELLEPQLAPNDPKRRMVEQMRNAGTRAAVLTRQLLAFGRRQALYPVVLDLNSLVTRMETMMQRLIGENIEIATSLLPDLGRVRADPTQIEQILMNLAVNARDAMPKGGTLTIETTNVELDRHQIHDHDEVRPGAYVMLAISDTGVGMDSQTKGRIFEPFFTTKQRGKGTGLGLSTVYGVVKQSSGYIYVYSEPDLGTTFRVYLPWVLGEVELTKRKDTAPLQGGRETILLVEDYAPLRELAREMLEGLGYTVLDSGRPSDAIRIAQHHGGQIALLITDVVMPEVNGRVLAESLTALRPGMKVLYTSGYTDEAIAEQCELEVGRPLLDKPFKRHVLAKRVRELLDSDGSAAVAAQHG